MITAVSAFGARDVRPRRARQVRPSTVLLDVPAGGRGSAAAARLASAPAAALLCGLDVVRGIPRCARLRGSMQEAAWHCSPRSVSRCKCRSRPLLRRGRMPRRASAATRTGGCFLVYHCWPCRFLPLAANTKADLAFMRATGCGASTC
jgi:hypothetical protein